MNQECPVLFFRLRETSGSENQSPMDISWNPSKVLTNDAVIYSSSLCTQLSNILWSVGTESTVRVRNL